MFAVIKVNSHSVTFHQIRIFIHTYNFALHRFVIFAKTFIIL